MKNTKIKLLAKLSVMGLLLLTFLSGCGNNRATVASNSQSNQSSVTSSSSSESNLQVTLQKGKFQQASGLLSVPVVMKNTGYNTTLIDSKKFTLHVGNVTLHPYQLGGEAADYHLDFSSNDTWQNTLTFNTGVHLTNSELKSVKLTYKLDNGKSITAKNLNTTASQSTNRVSMSQLKTTDLGSYYKSTIAYIKEVNKQKEKDSNADNITSVEDKFQDANYDQLRMWVAIPSTGPQGSGNIVIKILNNTNSDFVLPYDDFELKDKNNNEVRVNPSYRQYMLYIPHGKYTTVAIPMEEKIVSKNSPYHVEMRVNNGNFFDVNGGFFPAEVIFSNQVDANTIFSQSPKKYPSDDIQWSNQAVDTNNNRITADVKLTDYFYLDNKASGYKVVGSDDNGNQKVVGVTSASPRWVPTTDKTTVKWKVKNLSDVMNYPHVALQYDGQTILNLK